MSAASLSTQPLSRQAPDLVEQEECQSNTYSSSTDRHRHGSLRQASNAATTSSSLVEDCDPTNEVSRRTIHTPRSLSSRQLDLDPISAQFSINKLRFGALPLCGREKEQHVLRECLERVSNSSSGSDENHNDEDTPQQLQRRISNKREMVLIRGVTGSGKTALAESLAKRVERMVRGERRASNSKQTLQPRFIRGKFDLSLRDEPYKGIACACDALAIEIRRLCERGNTAAFESIRDELVQNLGDEQEVLTRTVPSFEGILGGRGPETTGRNRADDIDNTRFSSLGAAKDRFNYAFKRFFRVMASQFCPLVLLLDDLQWADAASLELLEAIITDREMTNLMVIGCYRSDEVEKDHMVSNMIKSLNEKKDDSNYNVTKIFLEDLTVPDVNSLLANLLSTDEARTMDLAVVCHQKTHGNPFHLIMFLTMLYEHLLLEYNLGVCEWTWNVSEIESETPATKNVVDLMKCAMSKLHNDTRMVLLIAACLGSRFRDTVITCVWTKFTEGSCDQKTLTDSLELAVQQGFIVPEPNKQYRWTHDNIQQAGLSLVTSDKLASERARVGEILAVELNDAELEAEIFVVVNLLDQKDDASDANVDSTKQIRIAELNLRAAQKALELSAMASASRYATNAISHLPTDKWTRHYELTVELHSIAAEAECSMGNATMLEQHCSEVLAQECRPLLDKMRVYHARMDNTTNHDLWEALDQCLNVLQLLGCVFPKKKVARALQVAVALRRLKGIVRKHSYHEICSLPMMTDPRKVQVMKLLEKLTTYCYLTGSNMLFVLVVLRSLEWTIRYGLNDIAPSSFASGGIILVGVVQDFEGASLFGRIALALLRKLQRKRLFCRTQLIAHLMVLPWTNPVQSHLKPMIKSYKTGLEAGDTENAFYSISSYLQMALQSGRSLKSIEQDCCTYIAQMRDFNRTFICKANIPLWQMVVNLMGKSRNTALLSGNIVDAEEIYHENDPYVVAKYETFQNQLYAWFGEHELGAELAIKRGDTISKAAMGAAIAAMDPFFKGISLFAMARKTQKRRYRKHAKKMLTKLKSWVEKGNPNMIHHEALLEAEMAALSGRKHAAVKHYKLATISSAKGGFVHDAGMANERFGEFLLEEMSDREEAAYRFEQAIKFYSVWGAEAKVDQLKEKHSGLIDVSQLEC